MPGEKRLKGIQSSKNHAEIVKETESNSQEVCVSPDVSAGYFSEGCELTDEILVPPIFCQFCYFIPS